MHGGMSGHGPRCAVHGALFYTVWVDTKFEQVTFTALDAMPSQPETFADMPPYPAAQGLTPEPFVRQSEVVAPASNVL